jgi:hypothetical protein
MTSAFGVEHTVSKLAVRPIKKPKGKLVKIKTGAVNASHKVVEAGAGPTPASVALRSFTPLRAVLGH